MPRRLHVLLVEDDELTALNTRRALRRSPAVAAITLATDGRDALDRLQRGDLPAERLVVVTDLSMPRMAGLELVAAIRLDPTLADLLVAVLTTSNDEADRAGASALRFAAYFVKAGVAPLDELVAWLGSCQSVDRLARP